MSALSDYAKFDKLEVSDDEAEAESAPSLTLSNRGESVKFDQYDAVEFTAAKNIKKTPLSEMGNAESSEDDSDEGLMPIFRDRLSKKAVNSEFVKSLQAIADEATPLDSIESYKDQGNEHYKRLMELARDKKGLKRDLKKKEKFQYYQRTAIRFYTDAVLVDISEPKTEEGLTGEELRQKLVKTKAQALTNRAMVHFQRGNFRKCLRDCKAALRLCRQGEESDVAGDVERANAKVSGYEDYIYRPTALDSTRMKACFHAAKACNTLQRYKNSLQYLKRGFRCLGKVPVLGEGGEAEERKLEKERTGGMDAAAIAKNNKALTKLKKGKLSPRTSVLCKRSSDCSAHHHHHHETNPLPSILLTLLSPLQPPPQG